MNDIDTVVLAGGRGSRFGGLDKGALQLGGASLVERVLHAARGVFDGLVIVVGPDSSGRGADLVVREEPAFAGPLAGLAAGLGVVRAPWVALLSCDLEFPQHVCAELAEAMGTPGPDGVVLVDEDGKTQWLAGCYRVEPLRAACENLGDAVVNAPLRKALAELDVKRVRISNAASADLDTPEALERARARHRQ